MGLKKKKEATSPQWIKLQQLEEEVDLANDSIANNFKALRAIEKLKNIQLKELKKLVKDKQLDKEVYQEQKENILENAEVTKNGVLEELTYNTSFIVSKYDELTTIKYHEDIKEINKKHKQEKRLLNKKIKQEKKEALEKIDRIISVGKQNNYSKEYLDGLRRLKKSKSDNIDSKHSDHMEAIEDGLIKSSRSTSYRVIVFSILIIVPTMMLIGLLLNYLVYLPNTSGKFSFSDKENIAPFVISMLMIVIILVFVGFLIKRSTKRIVIDREQKTAKLISIGFVSSFFDILGVGSFATSLGLLKATKSFDDDKMVPGTLNMAFSAPILMEGSFLVSATGVDIPTLVILVVCAVVGSYIGAMLVNKLDGQIVKICISVALFIAAIVMILTTNQVGVIASGKAFGLMDVWWKMIIAVVGFLLIGILMAFGVGSYAPSMAILGLLGMSPLAIAPIMMCSSAFLMPLTSYKFYKDNNYLPKTSLTLMIGGLIGATVSFIFFYIGIQVGAGMDPNGNAYTSLIKWLTIAVMFYSSITMFFEWNKIRKEQKEGIVEKFKRKPLHEAKDKKEFNIIRKRQFKRIAKKYNNDDLDAKSVVEEENIPIEQWVKHDEQDTSDEDTIVPKE